MRQTGVIAAGTGVVLVALAGLLVRHRRPAPPRPPARPVAATRPTTVPARVRPKRPVYATYMDAVRSANRAVAATQPLGTPVDLADAAHVVLHDPVYVDPAGNLWITRPDGRPTAALLARLARPDPDDADAAGPEFVLRDRPVFVHWSADDTGPGRPPSSSPPRRRRPGST